MRDTRQRSFHWMSLSSPLLSMSLVSLSSRAFSLLSEFLQHLSSSQHDRAAFLMDHFLLYIHTFPPLLFLQRQLHTHNFHSAWKPLFSPHPPSSPPHPPFQHSPASLQIFFIRGMSSWLSSRSPLGIHLLIQQIFT